MKRHWILGVLWLVGCGAGSPANDAADSTLESPLSAADDDSSSDDLSDSELASEFISNAGSDDEAATDENAADDDQAAPKAGCDADDAPEAAPGAPPAIVVGAGGEPWEQPTEGVVVWCHASVPLDCPAIEPTPSAGRLVVVRRSAETGEFAHEGPDVEPAFGVGIGGAASTPAGAAPGAPSAGASAADAAPAPSGAPLPVDVGGSLPPLPGTCVAITFAGAGAAGEPASDVAPASDERVAHRVTRPAPGESATSAPLPPLPPLPGIPALPPRGGCIGLAFPATPAPLPVEPPHSGAGPTAVPVTPDANGCVSVAFAATSSEDDAAATSRPAPAPAGAAAKAPGMPRVCATHSALPGNTPAGTPGAPVPPVTGGVEVHQVSDAAPASDEASTREVR